MESIRYMEPAIRMVLRGFEKIELEPGESATVSITIPASDLAFVGMDGKWRLEEGDFIIKMGNLNTRIRCTEDFVWKTPKIIAVR